MYLPFRGKNICLLNAGIFQCICLFGETNICLLNTDCLLNRGGHQVRFYCTIDVLISRLFIITKLTTSSNIDRCPCSSSPSFPLSSTEYLYTSPALSATMTSVSLLVKVTAVERRCTCLKQRKHTCNTCLTQKLNKYNFW